MNQIKNQFNLIDVSNEFMVEILYKMYNGKKMELIDWNFEEKFIKDVDY